MADIAGQVVSFQVERFSDVELRRLAAEVGVPAGRLPGVGATRLDLATAIVASCVGSRGEALFSEIAAQRPGLHAEVEALRASWDDAAARGDLTVHEAPTWDLRLASGAWERDGSHPSALLCAAHEVVAFDDVGRAAEIALIEAWLATNRREDLWLWTGPGGAGKTRLCVELGRRLRARGWRAGFLLEKAEIGELDRLDAPYLVVVDYAESRVPQVQALLAALVRRTGGPPVRVLLLARRVSDWWVHDLRREPAARAMAEDGPEPRELAPLADTPARREALFEAALVGFRARLPEARGTGPRPELGRPLFGRALYNLIGAFAWLHGHRVEDEAGALDFVLDRERDAWMRAHAGRSTGERRTIEKLLQRSMTAVTLVGGAADGDTLEALTAVAEPPPKLGPDLRGEVVGLRDFYGRPGGGLDPLEPDLLGEQLAGRVLGELGDKAGGWLESLLAAGPERALERTWQVLGRLAERDARARGWLRGTLNGHLLERAERAVAVAAELGEQAESVHAPLGKVIAEVLEGVALDDEGLAMVERIHGGIALPNLALRELGAVTAARVLAGKRGREGDEDLASWAGRLGFWLNEVGDREGALAATREAVDILRRFADERPDTFLPDLASSLNNLGGDLADMGDREGALAATREAVDILRRLADERPGAFLPGLASSLNNLGIRLSNLGDREGALAAAREATDLYRHLAAERPGAFLPDLANSLNNLGIRLSNLGDLEGALAATREATDIRRRLADERPGAFLPDLASSLNNLGIQLSNLGDLEGALAAKREAVAIRRRLADERPDTFLPDLANSLNNLGNGLSDLGDREGALATTQEATDLYRRLADERPGAFLPDLAMSLNNLGVRLSNLGDRESALAAIREATDLYHRLADERPGAFLPDLASSLNNLGNRLAALGDREGALAATREAVEILRRLAAERPGAFLPDLAGSLNNLGIRLSNLGDREGALAAAREAADLYRRLAAERPGAFLPDLATSLNNLGNWLSNLGDREGALATTREAVEIRRRLAAERPGALLPDLATSLNNLGIRLSDLGDREGALAATRETADLYRRLADGRPGAFLPDLARSLNNLGEMLSNLGDREGALAATREAVEILRRLAAERPGAFLPDLASSLNNLGNRLSNLGDREGALAATREAVEIRRRLAAERPGAFLPDLARSLGAHGHALAAAAPAEAAASFAEGARLLLPFVQRHPAALGGLGRWLVDEYMASCTAARLSPDPDLLAAYAPFRSGHT